MAVTFSFILILTGLKGILCVTTVSKVPVKAGAKISIPCLYDAPYRNHVKYLCEGYRWCTCSYAAKTNSPSSGKFSISDDKKQRIFTVTIKNLTPQDTDYYWCAVEINAGSDDGKLFHLSVTTSTPSLYVDHQHIRAFTGDNITINCYHQSPGVTTWCRLGSSCVTESSGTIDGTEVTINRKEDVSTVTMSRLRTESSGWFLCVNRDLQMPVHLTVTEKAAISTHGSGTLSPTSASGDPTAQGGPKSSSSFIIRLSLLVLFVAATSFVWFMITTHSHNKESSATPRVQYKGKQDTQETQQTRSHAASDVDEV